MNNNVKQSATDTQTLLSQLFVSEFSNLVLMIWCRENSAGLSITITYHGSHSAKIFGSSWFWGDFKNKYIQDKLMTKKMRISWGLFYSSRILSLCVLIVIVPVFVTKAESIKSCILLSQSISFSQIMTFTELYLFSYSLVWVYILLDKIFFFFLLVTTVKIGRVC